MRIGTVRGFQHPTKRYAIFRFGKAKKQGGEGIKWFCTRCGSGNCAHLRFLWAYASCHMLDKLIESDMITLTLRGKKLFKYEG